MKASELEADYNSDSNFEGGKKIIDVEPSSRVTTTKVWPREPKEPEEGKCLFHSQMSVKGDAIHFIVDNGTQKILILVEVVNRMNLPMTPHPQPYTIDRLHSGKRSLCQPIVSSTL
jgi:hypothetical protein